MQFFKPKKKGILLTGRIRNVTILEETDIKYKIRILGFWYWVPGTWVYKNRIKLIS